MGVEPMTSGVWNQRSPAELLEQSKYPRCWVFLTKLFCHFQA
jgi:hypothetical protein